MSEKVVHYKYKKWRAIDAFGCKIEYAKQDVLACDSASKVRGRRASTLAADTTCGNCKRAKAFKESQ